MDKHSLSLETLLKNAEEATEPPPDPINGIPAQKMPLLVRRFLQSFIVPFLLLEIGMEKAARWIVPPPFKKVGTCKRRGNCCHYILLPQTKGLWNSILVFWHTEINGFYARDKTPQEHEGQKVLIMGCRYLKKNGSCGNYHFRPKICRTWPIIELFGFPRILKGCGYQAQLKKSAEKKYPRLKILLNEEAQAKESDQH